MYKPHPASELKIALFYDNKDGDDDDKGDDWNMFQLLLNPQR